MADQKIVDELREQCRRGFGMDARRLVSRPESWGTINFETAQDSLKTAAFLFEAFSTLPVEVLPDSDATNLRDKATTVVRRMETIDNFNIRTDNPSAQAAEHASSLKSAVDDFQRASFNLLPYLAYKRGDIQAHLANLETSVSNAKSLYDDGKRQIEDKAKLIEDALAAARTAAAKAGAAVFTQDFFTEAKDLDKAATKWLRAAAVLAGLALATAVFSWLWLQPDPSAPIPYLAQYTLTKLVVIGGLITGAVWCAGIYRALRHQIVVNRHRGNALKTFQAFTEAAGDNQEVRSAVLLETTRSIFAVVPSGFLNATETNTDGGLKASDAAKVLGKGG